MSLLGSAYALPTEGICGHLFIFLKRFTMRGKLKWKNQSFFMLINRIYKHMQNGGNPTIYP